MDATDTPEVDHKKKMTLLQIVLMSIGFFGIQHGFSIQFAKMSVIYEKLGAHADQIPGLWLAAPLTGLIIQPVIGYLSDRTWGPLGRRRPYFLIGAILATIALVLMPSSNTILMAACLLWLLDASINISMQPFRAFIADKLPSAQVATGYAMQTLMIGIGGALGYFISATDWVQVAPALKMLGPTSLHIQFYLCAIIYMGSVLITVFTTPEDPPENLAEIHKGGKSSISFANWFKETGSAIKDMPKPMMLLGWVQFFTWLGLFCMFIFYSVAVAHHVFGATDATSKLYDHGVTAAGNSMSFYQIISTAFALLIPVIAAKTGRVNLHTIGLALAGLSLISFWFLHNDTTLTLPLLGAVGKEVLIYLPMVGIGIGWATTLSMPYAILVDHVPKERYGIYMGIFNVFVVIPEILSSVLLGWIMVNVFHNNQMMAIVMGGGFMLIAAVCLQTLRKYDNDNSTQKPVLTHSPQLKKTEPKSTPELVVSQ